MRLWRSRNKERWSEYTKALRKKYPERYKAYHDAYLSKNPERVLELRKLSNIRRRHKISEDSKAWYAKNKDRVRRYKNEYERTKCATDSAFRCEKRLRNRIIEVLKYQRAIKSARTKELIGCDRNYLVQWIEAKFRDGMTWKNHGNNGWHLDHIRPCASFDLSNPEEQKRCFHYTNLQPLWANDNRSKSDKCQYRSI